MSGHDHLSARRLLTAETPTIGDLARYSCVAHAPAGGISLDPRAAVRACLARIDALDGFVPMPRSGVPAA